jgi:invasion protein IalB
LKNTKAIKGKTVTFKLNGKKYSAKTNSNGVAQVTIKKNVIQKLKKGKIYTVQVTYLKNTVKTTLNVKS